MNIKVEFNESECIQKIEHRFSLVQKKLDAQVLKDSNIYCPLDTSMLQKSAITSSVLGSGLLIWNTPYAKAQYYGLKNKSLDKNPNASCKWFEVAKSKRLDVWRKLVDDEYHKNP